MRSLELIATDSMNLWNRKQKLSVVCVRTQSLTRAARDINTRQQALAGFSHMSAARIAALPAPVCPIKCCFHAKVSATVNGSYTLETCRNAHMVDAKLSEYLATLFAGKRVLEMGAGCGCYTHRLAVAGIDITALDGTSNIAELTNGIVQEQDVTVPFMPHKIFDWVLSLEVAEHIPQQLESNFLDALTSHARSGIALSWALPGQRGDFHKNGRSNAYATAQLAKRGWRLDHNATRDLRRNVSLFWFRSTTMLFTRA